LPIPAALYVGIGSVTIVIDLLPNFAIFLHGCARFNGTVPTQEAHILHEGVAARHPFRRHRTGVDTVGIQADACDDICSALRCLEEWLGTAYTLKGRRRVSEKNPGDAWVQTDQHCVWLQRDGIGNAILTGGQVDRAMCGDCLSKCFGVVSDAVSGCAKAQNVYPGV